MYSNYQYPINRQYPTYQTNTGYINNNDDHLIGGFAFPFLLGGVTGAALAPAFWGGGYGYNRPYYYSNNYYYPPYYYGPYYR